jgi:hypothetical protein
MPTTSHLRKGPVLLVQNSRGVVCLLRIRETGVSVFSQTFSDISRRSVGFCDSRNLRHVDASPSSQIFTIGSITTIPPANENHL